MTIGQIVKRILWILALVLLGPLLLLGVLLGIVLFFSFLSGFTAAMIFLPGMALYVFGFCLPFGLVQWRRMARGQPSNPFRLPGIAWLGVGAVVAIAIGQIMLATHTYDFYWVVYVLAAALPSLTALALASQRLGTATTWRRIIASVIAGSLLSPLIALFLTGIVTVLAVLLVLPLRALAAEIVASKDVEQLFYSPALVFMLVETAIVAPLVEEAAKPVAAILLAKRLQRPAEAFLVGMAGGAGFAIVENMLYAAAGEGAWAHISALRGVGGVLHPLTAGLVAVGWYGVRNGLPGALGRLIGLYGLAVGAHALWNGGLGILYSNLGAYFFGTESWQFNIYGIGQPGIVMVFMLLEAIALWRVLYVVTGQLAATSTAEAEPLLELHIEQPRQLALWASAALLLVVPIAALYGPLVERYLKIALPIR